MKIVNFNDTVRKNKYGKFVSDYGSVIDLTFYEIGRMSLAFGYINFCIRNSFYRIPISLP